MKRKGLTVVVILAVIAILIIIALPNIFKMYNESQRKMFL